MNNFLVPELHHIMVLISHLELKSIIEMVKREMEIVYT